MTAVVDTTSDVLARASGGASGDVSASSEERFARYIAPEVDFVRRVSHQFSRTRSDAEDLAQEVLTRAFRGIEGFDGRYPKAWLRRITANTAASRARRKRVDEVALDTDLSGGDVRYASADAGPADVALFDELDPEIEQALRDLPDQYRVTIELVDMAGMSYEEAAAELDVPIGTVMSRLHRGRGKLRDALADAGYARAVRAVAPV